MSGMPLSRGVLLLSLLLLALYAPTLGHGFHFDDYHMVVNNQFIKDWRLFPHTIATESISSVPVAKGMYRPVLMASFALNYQTGGLNPVGYHLSNIWLHILTACLAVGLAARLWPNLSAGGILLGAALWAVHPIQTEAVAYVASRSSVLATLWMVLSLWLYASRRWFYSAGALAAYALALGSKEIAVTLPGLLLLVEWRLERQAGSARTAAFLRLLPFLLLTAAYLLWRKVLLGVVGVTPLRPWGENFRMQLEGIPTVLRLLFWPLHQSVVHPQPTGEGIGPWIGFGLLAGLGSLAWVGRRRFPGLTFALSWAGITFLPVAFASSLNLVVAEHHLYLPSLGFALGLPAWSEKRCLTPFLILLVGMLGVATVRRNAVWKEDFTLWQDASRRAPGSAMVQNNLGLEYESRGEMEEALACYLRAVRQSHDRIEESTARNNLGNAYSKLGQPEAALQEFRRCLELNRFEQGLFYNNIGLADIDLGRWEEAEEAYTRALEADPRLVQGYLNLGVLRFRQDRKEQAGFLFEQAVGLDPDYPLASLALGKFYISRGKFAEARRVFQRFVRVAPRLPDGYLYLAIASLRERPADPGRAERYLARAIALGWKPDQELLEELTKLKSKPQR